MKWTHTETIEVDGQMINNKNPLSVIIRSKNEERWIGHTIQSVIDTFSNVEIILIDNGSTDDTLFIVKNFIEDPNFEIKKGSYADIKIFNLKDYTPGKSINYGVTKCKNDIIMILSAHCVIQKFDKKIFDRLEKFKCLFGKQVPIWNGKKISKRYIWSHFIDDEKVNIFSELENRYFFHNAASMFNKSLLLKYPFNENLTGKEDRYWINKYVKNNNDFLYTPFFEVHHHYTLNGNTWKGLA